jgi:hypothetical protein
MMQNGFFTGKKSGNLPVKNPSNYLPDFLPVKKARP